MMLSNQKSDNEIDVYDIKASLQYTQTSDFVYQEISLSLPLGQVTCLLGQSGCGKSSLLKQLVGLHREAYVADLSIQNTKTDSLLRADFQQNVAYMAQQDLLLPWLSVLDNVLLTFDLNRLFFSKKSQHNTVLKEKALSILEQVGMRENANSKVFTLSGGMRQRVALARTLIQDKAIILMDEPFSSVDAITRHKLQQLSSSLFINKTVLLVTHDPLEALIMGHNLLLFPLASCAKSTLKNERPSVVALEKLPKPNSLPPRVIGDDLSHFHARLMQKMQAQL